MYGVVFSQNISTVGSGYNDVITTKCIQMHSNQILNALTLYNCTFRVANEIVASLIEKPQAAISLSSSSTRHYDLPLSLSRSEE